MPVEKESRIAQWIAALREGWPAARAHLHAWVEACREEPVLIWQTTAVRYTVYGLGGLIALWLLTWGLAQFQPVEVHPPAETADFHVLCIRSGCGHHFIVNKEFDFDDFPVTCPRCRNETGELAFRCTSETCRSRWVNPRIEDQKYRCPRCGGYLGEIQ